MLSFSNVDISLSITQCSDLTTTTSDKILPRTPLRARYQPPESLPSATSIESLVEINIPSPSLGHDFEMSRLMSPAPSHRSYQQKSENFPSTPRPNQPTSCIESDRDSFVSIYDIFGLQIDRLCEPYHPHRTPRPQSGLLPAPLTEYRRESDTSTAIYSALLRTPTTSPQSTVAGLSDLDSKRSVTPSQLHRMLCGPDSEVLTDYSSCFSNDTVPDTPRSSLVPSLSFASTLKSSPSSIMSYQSYHSTNDTPYHHAATDHLEFGPVSQSRSTSKQSKPKPKHITLNEIQTKPDTGISARNRNISAPTPSPQFPDAYTAAALSYDRSFSTTSPPLAPVLSTAEVSAFDDDSDDENSSTSRRPFNRLKSAFSSQNLRNGSRARAESVFNANAYPLPKGKMVIASTGRASGSGSGSGSGEKGELRNSKGSTNATVSSKPSTPATPTRSAPRDGSPTSTVRVMSATSYQETCSLSTSHEHHPGSKGQDHDHELAHVLSSSPLPLSPRLKLKTLPSNASKLITRSSTSIPAAKPTLNQRKRKRILRLSSCFTLEPAEEGLQAFRKRQKVEKIKRTTAKNVQSSSNGKGANVFIRRMRGWATGKKE